MVINQGQRANSNGRSAEDVIYDILCRRGLEPKRQAWIGTSIYGTNLYADIWILSAVNFPKGLIIESKWQETTGSVDEKLPYLVENIKLCYPCPAIIVAAGGGMRPGAFDWLRRQSDGHRLVAVLTLEEFLTWTNRNL